MGQLVASIAIALIVLLICLFICGLKNKPKLGSDWKFRPSFGGNYSGANCEGIKGKEMIFETQTATFI